MASAIEKVRELSERFRKAPLAQGVVVGLHKRSSELWQRTFELLQRESPEYRNSVDQEFTKESKSHCSELLSSIIAVAAGQTETTGGDPFDFVRMHAEWRAKHHVPLTASLHAHPPAPQTYCEFTRDSLLRHAAQDEALHSLTMLSDFWIEFFDQ